LFEEINIVPAEEFKEFVPKAEKMLSGHIKDVPYLALALNTVRVPDILWR
jgi:predicted nucleic acid-binding protein